MKLETICMSREQLQQTIPAWMYSTYGRLSIVFKHKWKIVNLSFHTWTNPLIQHVYLDKGFRNLLAVLQHSDWRDDPVPLHPDHSLAVGPPGVKSLRMQLFLTAMSFCGAPHLQEATTGAWEPQKKRQKKMCVWLNINHHMCCNVNIMSVSRITLTVPQTFSIMENSNHVIIDICSCLKVV